MYVYVSQGPVLPNEVRVRAAQEQFICAAHGGGPRRIPQGRHRRLSGKTYCEWQPLLMSVPK